MNVELLRKARERMGFSQEDLAGLLSVDVSTLQRWEAGDHEPHPRNVRSLCDILNIDLVSLMGNRPRSIKSSPSASPFTQTLLSHNFALLLQYLASHPDYNTLRVQHEITRAIEEHIRMQTNDYAAMTRRDALQNLAAFFAFFSSRGVKIAPEETNKLCAAGITASGYLSRGNHEDMKLATSMLSHYLPALKDVANNSSKHRPTAINLISQALQIKAILAGHLEGLKASVHYGERAVHYAKAGGDITFYLIAARELANSYRHDHQYEQALETVEGVDAQLALLDDHQRDELVPPYLQSWFYAGLGLYSAYDPKNKKQQALTAMRKAQEAFAVPQDEQNLPGFINHCEANLYQLEGLTHTYLGAPSDGLEVFEKAVDIEHDMLFAKLPTAQRTHIGGLLDATFITLKLPQQKKNKQLSIRLWTAGIEGAKTLRSEKFFHKAATAYQIMESIWSDENDVQDLRDLIKKDW